jgi:hypothetical protein
MSDMKEGWKVELGSEWDKPPDWEVIIKNDSTPWEKIQLDRMEAKIDELLDYVRRECD